MRVRLVAGVVAGWVLFAAVPAMASTFTVTNLRSSGAGSLAGAITAADADTSPPTVVDFAPGLTGIINLTGGTLTLSNSMSIEGAPGVVIDGAGNQIFSVPSTSTTVSISGLEFSGGYNPTASGGAIVNSGTLTVSDSVFVGNASGGPGSSNGLSGDGEGGAISNVGSLTVIDTSFIDNSAGGPGGSGSPSGEGQGGAIINVGSLSIAGSTFTGNTAGGAGGSGSDSGVGLGGAIDTEAGSATIANSTFTANQAGGSAGAGTQSGVGEGGMIVSSASVTLTGDTIDGNAVGDVSGSAGSAILNSGGTVTATDTIVSDNTGALNCSGGVSGIASIEWPSEGSCGFDLPSADPQLGPLADNGGPTQTQALGAGSPAIGAVAAASDCPATDQRGVERPSGGCDVGAYELAPPSVSALNTGTVTATTAMLAAEAINGDVEPGTVEFQYGTTTSYGTTTAAQVLPVGSAPVLASAQLSGLTPGTVYHFRAVATNPDGTVYGPDQQFTTAAPASSTPPSPQPSSTFTFGKALVGPGGRITLPVNAPDAGRFAAKATFTVRSRHGNKSVTTTFTYGTAMVTSSGAGTFKLLIGVRSPAARELKLLGSRQVTIAVTFTPTGGRASTTSKKLMVRRNRKGKFS